MRDDGGPAFPNMMQFDSKKLEFIDQGMTLRDYFAAKALEGFAQSNGFIGYTEHPEHRAFLLETYATDAWLFADAMLKTRKA